MMNFSSIFKKIRAYKISEDKKTAKKKYKHAIFRIMMKFTQYRHQNEHKKYMPVSIGKRIVQTPLLEIGYPFKCAVCSLQRVCFNVQIANRTRNFLVQFRSFRISFVSI